MALYDIQMTKKGQESLKNAIFCNQIADSESSDFFDMRNGLVFEFRAKLGKTGFFGKTAKINRKNEKI